MSFFKLCCSNLHKTEGINTQCKIGKTKILRLGGQSVVMKMSNTMKEESVGIKEPR